MKIKQIRKINNESKRYDIQTKNGNYYANDILIHNSIIKIWLDENQLRISTNGVIDAGKCELPLATDNYKTFRDIVNKALEKYPVGFQSMIESFDFGNYTHIFEVVSPYNKVVVPHQDIDIYYLGSRNMLTQEELVFNFGFRTPKKYPISSIEECITIAKDLPYNEEGYVVVDKYFNRQKIKSINYVKIHKLKDIVTLKNLWEIVKQGETSEILTYFPEYTELINYVQKVYDSILSYITEKEVYVDSVPYNSRKDFAITIKDWIMKDYFFKRLDMSITKDLYLMNTPWSKIPDYFKKCIAK